MLSIRSPALTGVPPHAMDEDEEVGGGHEALIRVDIVDERQKIKSSKCEKAVR